MSERPIIDLGFSTIESGTLYAPISIARVIRNLVPTAERSLTSVRGPARYETKAAQFNFSDADGVFHASLDNGMSDMLLVRAGDTLYQHQGWSRSWATLATGLNTESRQKFPDQWAVVGNRIIWTNGISYPQVITSDGYVYPLGFQRPPSAPTALGPTSSDNSSYENAPPNWLGYSQVGQIGTVADSYQGEGGSLQMGSWYYYLQYEAIDGNIGPLSAASNGVFIATQQVRYDNADKRLDDLSDLTRSFGIKAVSEGVQDWVSAIRLYRTQDTVHRDSTPRLLARIVQHRNMWYQDNLPDALLTQREAAKNYIAVPQFKLMCPYQGGLAVANLSGQPGRVRLSEPGFAGTFVNERYIDPDPSGSEVYALTTYQGQLLAWTEHSMYQIIEDAEGLRSYPVSSTIGCVAPGSVQPLPDGTLIWMSNMGFHIYDGKQIRDVTLPVWFRWNLIHKAKRSRAVSYVDPVTREYVLAVPFKGTYRNNLQLVYDADDGGWRERDLLIDFNQFAITRDHRRYILGVGRERNTEDHLEDVFVLDHQDALYTPPAKKYAWESSELRMDPQGMRRFKLTAIYVGFIESVPENATVTVYKNGRWDDTITSPLRLVDNDFEDTWTYGTAVLGSDILRYPKLAWRKIELSIDDLASFRFRIESVEPTFLHLRAFRFDGDLLDRGGSRVPGAT